MTEGTVFTGMCHSVCSRGRRGGQTGRGDVTGGGGVGGDVTRGVPGEECVTRVKLT